MEMELEGVIPNVEMICLSQTISLSELVRHPYRYNKKGSHEE